MGLNLTSTSSKLLASAAILAAAAGVAGMGTYGAFTASTSASAPVSAATVNLASGGNSRLSVAASGAIPGDTVQRAFTLINGGDTDLTGITLTTVASPSSVLDTDSTNGLQLKIESCPVAWTESGTAPAYTYTCAGPTNPQITSVLASRPVIGGNIALSNLTAVTAARTDYLRVTLTVPASAGNDFQGKNSTIGFTFNAGIRGATSK